MCGIVGATATSAVEQILIKNLRKLEYRGYDSAGLAVLESSQTLQRLRVVGKIRELEDALQRDPIQGKIGIAHTRWATHGVPSIDNAHPFFSHEEFAVVHNGIIENHAALRLELVAANYVFHSQTDTEVIVHLLHQAYQQCKDVLQSVLLVARKLRGAYALAILCVHTPTHLFAVRSGCPLVLGLGHQQNYIASDPLALLSETQQFIYLDDNDIAEITPDFYRIYTQNGEPVERVKHILTLNHTAYERGEFRHFMLKEIYEQPHALRSSIYACEQALSRYRTVFLEKQLERTTHVHIVACGTSYHAGLIARYWFESIAKIPCVVETASEYRYRDVAVPEHAVYLTLSQSGETADTLSALRLSKKFDYLSQIAICNVAGSSLMRETPIHLLTEAGVEIGVASTKAFTTQLSALFQLVLMFAELKQTQTLECIQQYRALLQDLPEKMDCMLNEADVLSTWVSAFADKQHALFIGRGACYPLALEGALKMKEISYIHAEGYPGGELKHGPLALVDAAMPVIAVVPENALYDKTFSNLQEVAARAGQLFILTNADASAFKAIAANVAVFETSVKSSVLDPILFTLPLQLLAYHVAVAKGTDVDQPRNLAKSVTVE